MRLILKLCLIVVLALWSIGSQAQILKDPTRWKHEISHVKGDQYEVVTTCTITDKNWHLYSFNAGGDGTLMPPAFRYKWPTGAKPVGKTTEEGKLITENVEGVGIIHYFKNKIVYRQKFTAAQDGIVKGHLTYQTCNDVTCLSPVDKDFSLSYKVESNAAVNDTSLESSTGSVIKDSSDSAMIHQSIATMADTPADHGIANAEGTSATINNAAENEDGASSSTGKSNFALLLEGIGAGLLSIITPCVFAMLPMVISLFLKRSKTKEEGVKVALQYTLSIILIFAAFGLLLMLINNKNFLYEFSTNWITNVIFFLMFLIFAFSFLGGFEITLPSSWSTATDKRGNMNSFSGIFFMALTLAIVSFSCTAPFIGGLISEISHGKQSGPFFGFLGYGLGLGLPFTLFAIFPNWLTYINKQGGWLNVFKVTLGFIELALAFKFLSNADLAQGWRLLDREIFLMIWIAISLALAMYLFGYFKTSKDSELPENMWGVKYLTVPRLMFALTSLGFAIYLFPGLWGAPLNGMGAFLPPMGTFENFGGNPTSGELKAGAIESTVKYGERMKMYEPNAVKNNGLITIFDYKEALAISKKENKPVMLDFTGITCVNCRKMETAVWSDPEVLELLKNDFILASLYCDAKSVPIPESEWFMSTVLGKQVKNLGDYNSDLQITKYNSNTQPFYFFVDGDEQRLIPDGYGYSVSNANPSKFANLLRQAITRYKELHP